MNIKLVARFLLILIACNIFAFIACGITSCDTSYNGTYIQNVDTEIVITEPTVTQVDSSIIDNEDILGTSDTDITTNSIDHLIHSDIQYITFSSVDEAITYISVIEEALKLIINESSIYSYAEADLALLNEEKARLEEIKTKITADVDAMLKEAEKQNQIDFNDEKPVLSTKPNNESNNVNNEEPKQEDTQNNKPSTGKYEYATEVWNYLKNKGYSDAVCAGILGNFMSETGGHTLALNPTLYSNGGRYYGIAQWSLKYYPDVDGANLSQQLVFLSSNIEKEFNTFGYKYKKGFTYNDFLKLESPRAAALAFAKVYERCGSGSYSKRQTGAEQAYDYFT